MTMTCRCSPISINRFTFSNLFFNLVREAFICVCFKVRTSINLIKSVSHFYSRLDAELLRNADYINLHILLLRWSEIDLHLLIVIEFVFEFHGSATETNQLKWHSDKSPYGFSSLQLSPVFNYISGNWFETKVKLEMRLEELFAFFSRSLRFSSLPFKYLPNNEKKSLKVCWCKHLNKLEW